MNPINQEERYIQHIRLVGGPFDGRKLRGDIRRGSIHLAISQPFDLHHANEVPVQYEAYYGPHEFHFISGDNKKHTTWFFYWHSSLSRDTMFEHIFERWQGGHWIKTS